MVQSMYASLVLDGAVPRLVGNLLGKVKQRMFDARRRGVARGRAVGAV